MKKISLFFVIAFCFFFSGCSPKETPAEIKISNNNQEELYQIQKTDNIDEVKEIFKNLNSAKISTKFNGLSLNLKTEIEGKILITNQEVRTIDLGYDIGVNAVANFKKYRTSGTVFVEGFTNTDSNSLSLKSKNKLDAEFINDDAYMYLKGSLEEGKNLLQVKNKVSIQTVTENYKTFITSFMDVIKYYNPLDFLPNYNEFIETYHITICKTTKDSFTLRLQVPANLIFKELNTDLSIDIDVQISCANLLPVQIQFQADEIISLILENEYVEKYLSSKVEVEKSKLKLDINLKYGYYDIKELSENEKNNYKEYIVNS